MILSDYAVRKRVTVFVLIVAIVASGITAYRGLPLEAAPDVNWPHVFVQTAYRGVSPEDIEQSITIEIEKKLKGLEGVEKIKSISSEGMSSIDVEFTTDTDIDDALIKVKDKVDLAKRELPLDLENEPSVFEVNLSELPILVLSLASPSGLRQLTETAEDLETEIEAIPGVLEVDVVGGVTREIQIEVDPERMALYGIPFASLQATVRGENANVSGGAIRTQDGRYQLRVPAEFETVKDVEAIVVGQRGGEPVYLSDVATVIDGLKDRTSHARTNGDPAVSLYIKKRTGENIVTIVERVDAVLERMRHTWPAGTVVTRVADRAEDIRLMVEDLENNIVTGFVLVIVVVMLAMGFRNALLVSVSIPFSLLLSFSILSALGITLNMVVLFSLTLALGMLVDNAIVIIENIYRFMQQGVERTEAAMRATSEVAWPIIGSSLTTIGAFVPLLFWDGVMGGFMAFLPKTVIITLGSCLFVALVINPALASVFLKADGNGNHATADEVMSGGEHPMLAGGGRILSAYRWLVRRALSCRVAVVALGAVVLAAAVCLWLVAVGLRTPTKFFPTPEPGMAWVAVKPPEGADLTYVDQRIREVACRIFDPRAGSEAERTGRIAQLSYEDCLQPRQAHKYISNEDYTTCTDLPNVEHIYERATIESGTAAFRMGGSDNQVSVQFVDLADRRDPEHPEKHLPSTEIIKRIEARVKDVPGAEVTVEQERAGPPTGAPINIEIAGDDFDTLGRLADKVEGLVKEIPHVRNVRSDFETGSPTLEIRVDRRLAGSLGLTANAIGYAIKAAINGIEVSTYRERDEDYDIVVRFLNVERKDLSALERIFLPTAAHGLVPLTTVADIAYTGGLGRITRIDHRRVVTVKADVDQTQTTGPTARRKAEGLMESVELPPGVNVRFTGEMEFQQDAESFLSWAAMAALMIILLVLVSQFNSLTRPLVIMSAVVLSLGGVFLGLAVFRMPFNIIMTGVGVISLAGVVVNNGIVLVDYTDQLVDRGLSLPDAIVAAGATRLRPVVLTAASTILALLPMVTGVSFNFHKLRMEWFSESSQFWGGMAAAVIFGLLLATLLTLFVVPVLYSLMFSLREWGSAGPRWLACRAARSWWSVFDRRYGTRYAERWALGWGEARQRMEPEEPE